MNDIQSENFNQELKSFAHEFLLQILTYKNEKELIIYKKQIYNNIKNLIEIFELNQINNQILLDLLIIFLNTIEEFQKKLDEKRKSEAEDDFDENRLDILSDI